MNIEVFGYLAMIVCLISVLMKDIKKLRTINIISCAMFVIYGLVISSYPIVIMNFVVIIIHLYNLYKLKNGKI